MLATEKATTQRLNEEAYFDALAKGIEDYFNTHAKSNWNRDRSKIERMWFGDSDMEFIFDNETLYIEASAYIMVYESYHDSGTKIIAKVKSIDFDIETIAEEIDNIFDNEIDKYYLRDSNPYEEFDIEYER